MAKSANERRGDCGGDELTSYLAVISHELRTPLTGIRGYAEILLAGCPGPVSDRQTRALGEIAQQTHRLESMIEDFLVLAELTTEGLRPFPQLVLLADLISRVRLAVHSLCLSSGVSLVIGPVPGDYSTRADPRLAERALVNIVSNAIKFSPAGAAATLTTQADAENVIFTVHDEGMGIPEEEQTHLFEPLFTASNARHHRLSGPGLGLVVAHAIVRCHGGQIDIQSVSGAGTTVSITLPANALEADARLLLERPPASQGLRG